MEKILDTDLPCGMGCDDRATTQIQLGIDSDSPAGEALKFNSAEPRHNTSPLRDRCATDAKRPRDIRGTLKVINNVFFEHAEQLTTVTSEKQPQLRSKRLTLVNMKKLLDLADRLSTAMEIARCSEAELAKASGVSRVAINKVINRQSKTMKADTLAKAAKHLGVRAEWLRTGKGLQDSPDGEEARQTQRILSLLENLSGPIASLAEAIAEIKKIRDGNDEDRA